MPFVRCFFSAFAIAVTLLEKNANAQTNSCKNIPGDPGWPSADIWKAELPTAKLQMTKGKQRHPTYRIDVRTVAEVQKAVIFASKHSIRLTLLNSGHDFLGRNDAPN